MKKILITFFSIIISLGTFCQSAEAYNAGNEAFRSKDYKTAIENYEKYATLEGMTAPIAYVMGSCYYKMKDFDKAISNFNKALELKYNKPIKVHLNLISCYAKKKDAAGKLAQTENAYAAFPKYKKFAMMLTNHYYKLAAKEYQIGGKKISDAYDKYAVKNMKKEYKAELRKANENFENAKKDLEKALEYSPKDAKSANMLKDIEAKLKGK
jgi:tetratricopeptide (TPR) repeat protein